MRLRNISTSNSQNPQSHTRTSQLSHNFLSHHPLEGHRSSVSLVLKLKGVPNLVEDVRRAQLVLEAI
jgi:hypothetical protein